MERAIPMITMERKTCVWCKKPIYPGDTWTEFPSGYFWHLSCYEEAFAEWKASGRKLPFAKWIVNKLLERKKLEAISKARKVSSDEDDDLRAEIHSLIRRINELKQDLKSFVEIKGRKARDLYPMLLEDMNDAARELKDVLDVINKLTMA